jgi:hypothetical protein
VRQADLEPKEFCDVEWSAGFPDKEVALVMNSMPEGSVSLASLRGGPVKRMVDEESQFFKSLAAMATDIGWSASPAMSHIEKVGWTPEPGRFLLHKKGSLPVVGVQIDGNDAFVYLFIRTTSFDFDGERTDLHDCFSALLAASLRSTGSGSCSLWDVPHPVTGIATELYARYITLTQSLYAFNSTPERSIDSLKHLLEANIWTFEQFFWECADLKFLTKTELDEDFSYEQAEKWAKHVSEIIGEPFDDQKIQANTRRSPTWSYYRSIKSGISVYHAPNLAKLVGALSRTGQWETIEGINGRMFLSNGVNNIISFKTIRRARRILSSLNVKLSCKELALIPLENCFIAASGHHFLLIRGECGKNRFADERERIRKRHQIESEVLFPVSYFIWNDTVDDESFELLIRELLVREKGVHRVRKVSPSRERDGGRDLIAEWNTPPIRDQQLNENRSPYTFRRVIVQCKASRGTVGKSKVQDIGDTVEHYDAEGYFLCVSSWLSTTLTDHLEKRRSEGKFWVDWWTRYEIEERLRRHPDLVNKYPQVVTARKETLLSSTAPATDLPH